MNPKNSRGTPVARNTFPRISHVKNMAPQWKKRGPTCAYCADLATHRITLEVNHLRGEDETVDVCAIHSEQLPETGTQAP